MAKRYQHVYEVLHYELLILNFCFFTKSWAILSPVRVSKVWRIGWSGINITKEKGKGRVCMRNVCCWYQTSFKNVSCLKWMGGGQTYWPHWNAVYRAADFFQFMSTLMINIRSANGILNSIVHTIHQGYLYFVNRMFSWYTHECDFIYAHKKSTAFLVPILMKLTDARQCYV